MATDNNNASSSTRDNEIFKSTVSVDVFKEKNQRHPFTSLGYFAVDASRRTDTSIYSIDYEKKFFEETGKQTGIISISLSDVTKPFIKKTLQKVLSSKEVFLKSCLVFGDDTFVFSKKDNKNLVGFLCPNYIAGKESDVVLLPIVEWEGSLPECAKRLAQDSKKSLLAIMGFSRFTDQGIQDIFDAEKSTSWVKIMIFSSDKLIHGFENGLQDFTVDDRENDLEIYMDQNPQYHIRSLKEYLSINYFEPIFAIKVLKQEISNVFHEDNCDLEKVFQYKSKVGTLKIKAGSNHKLPHIKKNILFGFFNNTLVCMRVLEDQDGSSWIAINKEQEEKQNKDKEKDYEKVFKNFLAKNKFTLRIIRKWKAESEAEAATEFGAGTSIELAPTENKQFDPSKDPSESSDWAKLEEKSMKLDRVRDDVKTLLTRLNPECEDNIKKMHGPDVDKLFEMFVKKAK